MPVTSVHIRTMLDGYLDSNPDEKSLLAPLDELLDDGADLTSRKEFRSHVTAGAILADPGGRVLHIRHRALNRWLLPGGHLEAGDTDLLAAAQRELTEETGILASVVTPAGHLPIHIDAHVIPANPAKEEPEHRHFDFRFLFRTSADVVELQAEEVTAAAWRAADTIADVALRERVLRALR
ncbi:NUDIX hydrolase [Streptomyces aureoverticillatus]|uniref:NUDIX hydrolase n=1 Tax=Streptomyces aureoverticillatus TaxID=66871 RepID=UPI0013DA9BAC|nr:NUDIX domain-containing protein [Streptomyces aureoverticillatus]QIB44574.1 NUDIX domain-containing protein [Streptomyces aureoverticillatus]